jgi:hypothetical protein
MADIIGRGFDGYVQEQVLKRQEKLKHGQTDVEVVKWKNANSAFLRLTSGVNVSDDFVKDNLGLDGNTYKDSNLAKYFKLFAAQAYDGTSYGFTKGVGYNFQSSYGFASPLYTSYGLVPPPGLLSADIKALNRGSLREANIQIQCNNLQQFQIIEALYLRLKYSILLEWGHSLYYNNKGELIKSTHDLSDEFLSGKYSQTEILKKIQDERVASDGNYDAFFGLITNFEWTIRPDGGYDVSLRARSAGDVIESLKINSATNADANAKLSTASTALERDNYKSTLNKLLWTIALKVNDFPGLNTWAHGASGGNPGFTTDNASLSANSGLKAAYTKGLTNDRDLAWNEVWMFRFLNLPGQDTSRQFYLKLGALLRMIESFLTYYNSSKSNDPIFKIDYDFEENYCFTCPKHVSSDPRICLIPYKTTNTIASLTSGSTFYMEEIYDLEYIQFDDSTFNKKTNIDELIKNNSSNALISGGTVVDLATGQPAIFKMTKSGPTGPTPDPSKAGTSSPSIETVPLGDQYLTQKLQSDYANGATNTVDDDGEAIQLAWLSKLFISANYNQYYITDLQKSEDNTTYIANVLYKSIGRSGTSQIEKIEDIVLSTDPLKTPPPSVGGASYSYVREKLYIKKLKITLRSYSNTNFTGITTSGGVYSTIENSGFKDVNATQDYAAKMMHMYINMDYIAKVIADNINTKKGEINLYDFLDKLMSGVQNALGNINNFEIIYKEDTNTFKIIDNTLIPGQFESKINSNKQITEFLISSTGQSGYDGGSFIENLNFKTKLSNNFASMATIGAQANGAIVGQDATALSKWNVGLTDRIITTKTNPNSNVDANTDVDKVYLNNILIRQEIIRKTDDKTISPQEIDGGKNAITDILKAELSAEALKNQTLGSGKGITPIGFIPFDLELNMMGLSGPRIYESYTIDTRLLPKSYQDAIQFICSGVSHNISNGEWKTTLNSICGPKQKGVTVGTMKQTTPIVSSGKGSGGGSGGSKGVGLTSKQLVTKGAGIAEKLMKDLSLTKEQASGIVGNLINEGGLIPNRIENKVSGAVLVGKLVIGTSVGYGWAQWTTRSRQQKLADYAKSQGVDYTTTDLTDDINYGYLVKELQTDYPRVLKNLKSKTTLRDATEVILKQFEAPKDQSDPVLDTRTASAQDILDELIRLGY